MCAKCVATETKFPQFLADEASASPNLIFAFIECQEFGVVCYHCEYMFVVCDRIFCNFLAMPDVIVVHLTELFCQSQHVEVKNGWGAFFRLWFNGFTPLSLYDSNAHTPERAPIVVYVEIAQNLKRKTEGEIMKINIFLLRRIYRNIYSTNSEALSDMTNEWNDIFAEQWVGRHIYSHNCITPSRLADCSTGYFAFCS